MIWRDENARRTWVIGDFGIVLSSDQLIVDVRTEFPKLLKSELRELLSWNCIPSL